jgi:hypothetical protein
MSRLVHLLSTVLLLVASAQAWAQGIIVIELDTKPNNAQNFGFSWTPPLVPPLVNFTLDDDTNATFPNTRTFTAVPAGVHTLTQNQPGRWRLNALACTGDTDNGSVIDLVARRVAIDLDDGETITCRFTNWLLPSLRLQKRAYIANGTFNFTSSNVDNDLSLAGVQGNATFTTTAIGTTQRFDANPAAAGTQDSQVVAFGQPIVLTELQTPGFLMLASSPACTYTGGTLTQSRTLVNDGTTAGSFNISAFTPGDTGSTLVTCTFYNGTQANLAVAVTNGTTSVTSGTQTTYTITASNPGPGAASGARLRSPVATGLNCSAGPIACAASGGAVCPAGLTVAQLQAATGVAIPTLPSGGAVTVTLTCTVTATGL